MPAAAARRLPHQGAGPTPRPGWRRPRHTRCSRPASRGRGLGPALFPRLRPPPPPGAFRSSRAPCCGRRPGARPPSRGRGAWGGRSAGHTPRARPAGPRGTPRQILPPPPSRTQLRSGAASGSDSGLPAVLRGQPRGGCSGSGADGTRCLPPGLPAPPFPRPWRSPTHPQAPPVSAPLTPFLGGCAGSSVHSHAGQATAGCVQKPPEKEAMGQLGSWHLRAEAWLTCWMGFTFMQLLPHSPGQVAPRKEALGSANDVFQGWLELLRGRAPGLVCPVVSGREHTCQLYTGWLASLRVRRAGVSIPRPWLVSCSVPVSGLTSQSSFAEGGCLLAGQWVTETIWEWRECAGRAGSHTAWK